MILMRSTSKKIEELPGVNEQEESSFDDWEEGELPSDPLFNEEFKKQQQDLRKKEDELEKISRVITKKAELLKAENEKKAMFTQSENSTKKIRRQTQEWVIAGIKQGECLGFHRKVQTMTEISFVY